ncbi:MAG: DUF2784 domain-containing protein [Gammaproteobacteria bacterium]|nr:DUF2784 domain-containing protein [Gammaproteobacteria bacterium]
MLYRLTADGLVMVHMGFVAFVVLGGLLVLRWPRLVWVHLPIAIWGAAIEFFGIICPLTPLENYFRRLAGVAEYHTSFVEHYVLPILYPAQLTRGLQIALGILVVAINGAVYGWIYLRKMQSRQG